MRITLEMLHKVARDTVSQRAKADRDIIAAYLHGSLLQSEPLLGGTTDIDLFFIHNSDAPEEREMVRLTDEVHLDIAHHPRRLYRQARELRHHPWMGPTIYECKILYDPQHFMDFILASVGGQFNQADNVIARARGQAEQARQIWLSFQLEHPEPGLEETIRYLKAVEYAANSITSLSGAMLPERRLLLSFPQYAAAVGHGGLYPGLLGLMGGQLADVDTLHAWLPSWKAAIEAIPREKTPPPLVPFRINYYLRAFEALLGSDQPQAVLWPLISTWTKAAQLLDPQMPAYANWQETCQHLGIHGEAFYERVAGLDAYLDQVEEILDAWAQKNGVMPAA
jgi:hypothetical protein